jgi:hypothetical protein
MKKTVSLGDIPYRLLNGYQHLGGTYWPHLQREGKKAQKSQ